MRRLQEWQNLRGKVPVRLFQLLNISESLLLCLLESDRKDFFEALKHANHPKYLQYRLAAGVYPIKRLPDGVTETEAVSIAVALLKTQPEHIQRGGAWINYGGLRTLFIDADGTTSATLYVPAVVVEGDIVMFKTTTMPGTVVLV